MTLPSASELALAYGSNRKKRFGQHFLTDPRILDRICGFAGVEEGVEVVEIGPGCGTLTVTLMAKGAEVRAVEIDRDAAEFLRGELVPLGLELVEGDAKRVGWAELAPNGGIAVANLPYNVAVDITFSLLESEVFHGLTLMYQKEVADRIVARAGDSAYGSLSVMVELWADTKKVMALPPGAFSPPPKVHSAVVTFDPVKGSRIPDLELRDAFRRVVKTVFEVRRKTLLNGLKRYGLETERAHQAIVAAGLDPSIRPERVSFAEFLEIAQFIHAG